MKQCSGQPLQKAEYTLSLRHHDSGSRPNSRPAASCASQKAIARSAVYLANQPTPRFRTFLHAHHATNVPQFSSAALPRSTTSHPRFPHDDGLTLASRLLCLPSAPTTRQHLNIFRTTNPHLSPHTLDKDLRTGAFPLSLLAVAAVAVTTSSAVLRNRPSPFRFVPHLVPSAASRDRGRSRVTTTAAASAGPRTIPAAPRSGSARGGVSASRR